MSRITDCNCLCVIGMRGIFLFILSLFLLGCGKNDIWVDYSRPKVLPIIKKDTIKIQDNYVIIQNPYKNKGVLELKGALHNHTDNSLPIDGYGSGDPYRIGCKFRDEGNFDFYTITDHNVVTGDPGVDGIVWLGNAVEDTKNSQHLCVYNLPYGYPYKNKGDDIHDLISYYQKIGAVVSYAHPDWDAQLQSNEKISTVNDVIFVEALNSAEGGSMRAYNILLSKGENVYCVGVDDYHYNTSWTDPDMCFDKSFVIAYSDAKEYHSIWKSLLAGCFYASKGAKMDICCEEGVITVKTSVESDIDVIGVNVNYPEYGRVVYSVKSSNLLVYEINEREPVVWVRVSNVHGLAYSQAFKIIGVV